ncbi:PREDICTED: CHD3-type chromatin-remodeling factor PICKLE [Brassica oleracea var. oleracea]|uniref:CHD3-type chromatin-remodeling factor PICKLE n=1 Tax=Brassica oleracea var. oleracea TaxID=109376 RepID=UPI0006A70EDB|nr:PREDICTED: CHD3-type chromatin-remodeling factor PICKLE [Brassica oleracea var. oleracea]
MTSLAGSRLRKRPDRRPLYTVDDSDDDDDFVQNKDQTTEVVEGTVGREAVTPLTEMEKILDCQMRPTTSNDPDSSDIAAPKQDVVKQYLVKWKGLSYLHCSWVAEEEFQKAYKFIRRLRSRVIKFHSTMESMSNSGDDFVAIHPEWTIVDRIIDCRGESEEKEYLVKFKELSYDECYWESESDISTFQNEIQRFKDINSGHRRDKYVDHERNHEDFKQFDHTPEFITGSLHPYQLEGINFLRFTWSNRTHVILADEMGLGKTIQSIAFLASLFEENLAPYLVVAPLSTLRNWEREFATWAPHMNVVMYGGTSQARTVVRDHEFYFPKGHNKMIGISGESRQDRIKFDVILTSYEMINVDTEVLKPIKWKCMIVDEGHRLKNKNSKLFNSLKQYTSEHRILLTGTPLQNNLDELFVLMHFLDAEKFGSLEEFQEQFKDIDQEEQISRLHKMLAPHLLRRVKKDVLKDMPSKKELILRVDLSSKQKIIYKAIMTRNYKILAKRGAKISNVLMELRKACLHPYMVEGVESQIKDANEALKELLESSGKLQLLDQMMVKLKEQGHRVLIYSQFQHMLDLLEDYCAYKKWFYERIDGKVNGAERQARIDRFNAKNSNRFCFLLSTRAGGVGINLATADTVFIYDSDWNPYADLQAMARAHRIGQTEKVMIYRLISRGTIEEKIVQICKRKMLLELLVVGKLKAPNLSQEELDDIIRFGSKELFAEENDEAGKFGKIHYDDAAIEKLLDRDHIDAEEDSVDDENENGFFKAFKVANFEFIDDNEAAASEEAQAIESKSSSENYWECLLKDKYEVQQAEEVNALGKRKRNCKQKLGEDELAYLEASSDNEEDEQTEAEDELAYLEVSSDDEEAEQNDGVASGQGNQIAYWPCSKDEVACFEASSAYEEAKPMDGEAARQGNQMAKRPYHRTSDTLKPIPLIEGEGRFLKVLGFNELQRKKFLTTLERYGVGNYDWKEFVDPLKPRTYDEIKNYGLRFLKHIVEDKDVNSPTFSDGVPKEELKCKDVLARIASVMLVQKKVKHMEANPRNPVFSDRIIHRFPGLRLRKAKFANEECDRILLRAVSKNGVGKWRALVNDREFGIYELVRKELNIPATSFINANGIVKDPHIIITDHMRRRFLILEEAIINEFAEDYYFGGKPSSLNRALKNGLLNQRIHLFSAKFRLLTERALHEFASKNISRNLSAIGTYVNVNMEDEQVTEVIMLDD